MTAPKPAAPGIRPDVQRAIDVVIATIGLAALPSDIRSGALRAIIDIRSALERAASEAEARKRELQMAKADAWSDGYNDGQTGGYDGLGERLHRNPYAPKGSP